MKLDRPRAIGRTDQVLLEWKPVQRAAKKWRARYSLTQMKKKNKPWSHFHNYYNGQTAKQATVFLCNEIVLVGLELGLVRSSGGRGPGTNPCHSHLFLGISTENAYDTDDFSMSRLWCVSGYVYTVLVWLVYPQGGQLLHQGGSTLLWISDGRSSFSRAENKNSVAIVFVRKYVFLRFQPLKLCYLCMLNIVCACFANFHTRKKDQEQQITLISFSCTLKEPIFWEVQCNLSFCSLTCWDNLHVSLRSRWFGRLTFLSPINTKCYQKPFANCNLLLQRPRRKLGIWLPICSYNSVTKKPPKHVGIVLCRNFISKNIWEWISAWDLGETTLIYSNHRLSFILASSCFYVFRSSSKCRFR